MTIATEIMDESFSKVVIKAITKEATGDIDVIDGAQGIGGAIQGLILTDDFTIAEKWARKMPVVFMCENKADENLNDLLNARNEDKAGKILQIYKYSKVSRLINACSMWNKKYCRENVSKSDVANSRENIYKMVVVCSAQGGTGCSSFARLMAKRFASEKKRVLLIGFDNIEPPEEEAAEDGHTHREFIYKILNKRSDEGLDVMDYVSLQRGIQFYKGQRYRSFDSS